MWHNSAYDLKQIIPPQDTSVAIAAFSWQWARSMGCPAFHRPNAIVACPDTPLAHSFCSADGSPNNLELCHYGFFIVGEKQSHCRKKISMLLGGHFHSGAPRLCLPCLPSRDAAATLRCVGLHGDLHTDATQQRRIRGTRLARNIVRRWLPFLVKQIN